MNTTTIHCDRNNTKAWKLIKLANRRWNLTLNSICQHAQIVIKDKVSDLEYDFRDFIVTAKSIDGCRIYLLDMACKG